MNKLKILELFGGIGACSKALERLGIDYEIADYVEIDKYAVKSFNAIHNTNFEPQDICLWDKDIKVDLLMHGSPCQDFSLAGKQAGGDKDSGTRSSLMYETNRIVEKLKQKYVIWENVKNLLSKKHRHNFDAYLETMEQLGYTNYYQVLNAKNYGIPQNRERVFTISILGNEKYEFPAKEELKPTMHDLLEENVKEKYYLSENMTKYVAEKNEKSNFKVFRPHYAGEEKIAHTIQTSGGNRADDNFIVFQFPPKQELKLKLKDMLENDVDEKYYLSDKMIEYISADNEKWTGNNDKSIINKSVASAINTGEGSRRCDASNYISNQVEENFNLKIKNNTKLGGTKLQREVCNKAIEKKLVEPNDVIEYTYSNARLKEIDNNTIRKENKTNNQIMCTLVTKPDKLGIVVEKNLKQKLCDELIEQNKVQEMDVIRHSYSTSRMKNFYKQNSKNNNTSPTLDTRCDCLGVTVNNQNTLRIRKLTPKECWRLMGFDDADFEKAAKVNSNSQLYKQAGNSIVVNVLEAILNNLLPTCQNQK